MTEWEEKLENLKNIDLTDESIRQVCADLFDIVQNQPNQSGKVIDFTENMIKKENLNFITPIYIVLGQVAYVSPESKIQTLDLFLKMVQDERNSTNSLHVASNILCYFSHKLPSYLDSQLHNSDVSDFFKMKYRTKRHPLDYSVNDSLADETYIPSQSNYKQEIRDRQIEMDKKLQIVSAMIKKDINSSTLNNTQDAISDMLLQYQRDKNNAFRFHEKLGYTLDFSQICNIIQTEIRNPDSSFIKVVCILRDVIKHHPELCENAYNIVMSDLTPINRFRASYYSAFFDIQRIYAERNPNKVIEIVNDLVDKNIIKTKEKADQDITENWNLLETGTQNTNLLSTLQFLAKCMKYSKVEDFSEHQELMKLFKSGYNMRFSTLDEINHAYESFGLNQLETMRFSSQQRCMNILMGQVEKELNVLSDNINQYRKNSENNKIYQSNKDWCIPASFNASEIFGCYFPAYIKQTEKYLSTHDAVYWLPQNLPENKRESFRSFVQRNLIYDDTNGQRKTRPLAEMEIISKNWRYLKPEDEKLKYKDILAICKSRKYANQKYEQFAVEAASWGVNETEYKNWESVYQAGLNVPEPFDSSKEFKFGKYTGKFLPREDVRTGFFGGYTDCCQHFNGAGKKCAISSVKDPYSQLFAIENDQGRIIAGSWVWENTEGKYRDVCFDNIEAIGEYDKNPLVNKIYEKVGKYLTEEANCHKVTIGLGYQDADVSKYQETEAIPLPTQYNDNYSDAKGMQVLLAENPNAKPLDKTKESTRFIRDVCFLDIDEMDKISEQCFPEGDERLQAPKDMSGLVLVDSDKGVVGYCLYDKDEKSIYDMAVLPEYRTDKNASSKKMFSELIKRIRNIGGEWHAELRDKTTYRYLDIMAQRGLVTFENHGVDHEMSDGSKVYSVTFNIPKKDKKSRIVTLPEKSTEYGD